MSEIKTSKLNGIQEQVLVGNTGTNVKTPAELPTYLQELSEGVRPGPVLLVMKGQGKSLLAESMKVLMRNKQD